MRLRQTNRLFLMVLAVASAIAPGAVAQQWDLLTVSNRGELMRVDLESGPNYSATTIGITRDRPGGPVRRIRGLAYVGSTLYGMTREGDLVTVNESTGKTTFLYSLGSGDFWSDLTYDPADNALYTVAAYGDQSLVKITGLEGTITHTVQGPTAWVGNGSRRRMLGVEFMNGKLLASNRQNDNIVEMDPSNGSFEFTWGSATSGVPNQQQIAVHPGTGVLWSIHDTSAFSNNSTLSTFDSTFRSTAMGVLPFTIGSYRMGGIAFVPTPGTASLLALGGLTAMRRRRR